MEKKHCVLLLTLLSLVSLGLGASINRVESLDEQLLQKWTTYALKFFQFSLCTQLNVADENQCFVLSQARRSDIAVYIGRAKVDIESIEPAASVAVDSTFYYHVVGGKNVPGGRHKVYAVLPDSVSTRDSKAHDAVLALDPYPNANFGHFVGLFYIDFGMEQKQCSEDHQVYTSDQTCITLARKPRCPNLLERNAGSFQPRRCHIDFLPTVYQANVNGGAVPGSAQGQDGGRANLLECVRILGFAPCPKLRSFAETEKLVCDGTDSNAKRCDTSYSGVGTRCKLFQTCDRAVLIGGGWNRMHSGLTSLSNMYKVNEMLERNGFLEDNIKMFFANGGAAVNSRQGGESRQMMSSAMKTGIRGHIRTVCETRHCAESFFLYLNNPTTAEGDMLLWDVDSNGIANELEVYTVKEFLSDISRCDARRVILLVDQSNANVLVSLIKHSGDHQNVIVFSSGAGDQLSTINGDITAIWANHSRPTSCLKHLHDVSVSSIQSSGIAVQDNSGGTFSKVSIIGAPCDLNPPLSTRELRSLYQGCQNVPTSIWFSLNYQGSSEDSEDDEEMADETDENSSNLRRTQ